MQTNEGALVDYKLFLAHYVKSERRHHMNKVTEIFKRLDMGGDIGIQKYLLD